MSPKSEREEILSALTTKIFSSMLDDIVLDATLQSHHEVVRSMAVCHMCKTRCGAAHVPGPSTSISQAVPPPSRPTTPSIDAKAANGSLATGTSTPTSVKTDGTIYLDCVNCSRPVRVKHPFFTAHSFPSQISSNRYAPHLSSCLGIGTGTRRGAARGTNSKLKNSEGGRSVSPSENGNISDGNRSLKDKGKSKVKRSDDAEFNLKRKRLGSPQLSPNKKQKKQKGSGSPVARVKTDTDVSGLSSNTHQSTSTGSHLKVPSKLRASSTASFIDRERSSSPGFRSSSPGTPVASISTPTSSAVSVQSGGKRKGSAKKRKTVSGGPPKHRSPPRLPPPVRIPEQDYLIDVEAQGQETGSSTDSSQS